MPNTVTGLFQTLILPAVAKLQQPTFYRNSMIRKVYVQPQPQAGNVGQTINVNIPVVNENDVVDIGNGPIQITDEDQTTVTPGGQQQQVEGHPDPGLRPGPHADGPEGVLPRARASSRSRARSTGACATW